MIKIKNVNNGETMQVWQTGIDKATGKIYCNGTPTAKYLAKYPLLVTGEKIGEDSVLILEDGWVIVKGRQPKPTTNKPTTAATVDETPTATSDENNVPTETETTDNGGEIAPVDVAPATVESDAETSDATPTEEGDDNGVNIAPTTDETTATPTEQPATENKPKRNKRKPTNKPTTATGDGVNVDEIKADLMAKYGAMGADIFATACKLADVLPHSINESDVNALIDAKLADYKPNNGETVTVTINGNESHTVTGKVTDNFKKIVTTVKKGYPLYMYGDAGTGKSHTAKQVADALGLNFYESQQVLFAHEMKGYGDAGGNFVPTPFFKAFTEGGLFFLDEIDASQPEALVVLNTAIANGRFDFPVIGNVKAHENFRVIAAGNTKMTGADLEYTARSVQDASTKNRFFFVHVDYCTEIENMLAGDDLAVADFCRDLRRAKTVAQINLCVSYRQIITLADKDLQDAWGLPDLLMGAIFKELESDEIRILYNAMTNTANKYARAMATLI